MGHPARPNHWLALGAALAGAAVALGAFGAHGLRDRLSAGDLASFDTGARYQMYHALGLIAVGLLSRTMPSRLLNSSGWAFLIGIILFSGSLYTISLTQVTGLGLLTPLGGFAFMTGWGLLALAAFRLERS